MRAVVLELCSKCMYTYAGTCVWLHSCNIIGAVGEGHGTARRKAWPGHGWPRPRNKQQLQLLQRPQIVSDVRDRLDGDALVDRLHLLRPHLRNPDPDRKLLTLRVERDGRPREHRRVRGWEEPARGRQAGTHHVCAREQESDRAAVDADVWQHERICKRVLS